MTTFEPLEARDVVLAAEADALVFELEREVDELTERMREVAVQVEAAEAHSTSAGEVELSQSAQLTLQFVDDLVATNRERMRELISQRYAWMSERLADAQAEAHAITNGAVTELTTVLVEHQVARSGHLDHRSVAELLASIAPTAPALAGPTVGPPVEELQAVEVEDAPSGPVAVPDEAQRTGADRLAVDAVVAPIELPDTDEQETDEAGLLSDEPVAQDESSSAVAAPTAAAAIDDVVGSAVQAVLRALADPGTGAGPTEPSVNGTRPASAPSHLDWILPEPDLGEGASPAESATDQPHHDFWGEKAPAPTAPSSRFRPRDLIISMLVLVVVVIVALALVG